MLALCLFKPEHYLHPSSCVISHSKREKVNCLSIGKWTITLLYTFFFLFYFRLRCYQNGGAVKHSAVLGLARPSVISKPFDWFLLCLVENVRTEVWVSWVSLTLVKMLWVLLGVSCSLVPVKLWTVFCFVHFCFQWLYPWAQPEYERVGGRQ